MQQIVKFNELPISEYIQQAIEELGWVEASPIQSQSIPFILQGQDVLGQAQTGTGKTGAFGIPAIEMVDVTQKVVQVLIMCPTRELALQVKEQIYALSKYKKGMLVTSIYGGESYDRQLRDLKKGCQVVVGTPGRIMDHMDRGTLKLDNLNMIILDEADEMLNMGFREDIEKILSGAPEERQTVLFSATMSKEIMSITKRFQNNPEVIKITKKEITNENIEQLYYNVRRDAKVELMSRLIEVNDLKLMLVFCNTKSMVDDVTMQLQERGYAAEGLHGDLRQGARNQVMNKFRTGSTTILVATDVAARGIDVNNVDAVFNYDVPLDLEYYVHRIGRTGRAGNQGKAFMFVPRRDMNKLRDLERYVKVPINEGKIPTAADLREIKTARFLGKVKENVSETATEEFDAVISQLKEEGLTETQIINALLKMQLTDLASANFSDDNLADGGRRDARDSRGASRDSRGGERGGRRFEGRFERGGDRGGDRRERSFGDRPERGGDRERRPRNGGKGSGEPGMARLFISLGKKDHVSPNHIVGALAAEAKIPGRVIGQIDMYDKFSFVEVPERDVEKVIKGMQGKTINAREASIEVAK